MSRAPVITAEMAASGDLLGYVVTERLRVEGEPDQLTVAFTRHGLGIIPGEADARAEVRRISEHARIDGDLVPEGETGIYRLAEVREL